MLIGHFGAALVLKRADARINLAWLCLGALLIDLVLWLLVLLGVEQVIVPPDYGQRHYFYFIFPFSHSLTSQLVWIGLAAGAALLFWRGAGRFKAAVVMAAAVASHWLLDLLVHPPQLPVGGEESRRVGLGLWDHIYTAVALEVLILAVGLWLYFGASRPLSRAGRWGIAALFVGLTAITVPGQLFSQEAVKSQAVAASSLGLLLVVIALAGWLDTKRASR